MERKITVGDIFDGTLRLFAENSGLAFGSIVCLTLVNVLVDQGTLGNGVAALGVIVSIGLQYWLIRQTVERRGMLDGRAGFGTFFGVNFLSGLAIMVGFLFLIFPGLYLLARWSVADAALFAEGEGVSAALGSSWEMTENHVWRIVGAYLVVFIPTFGLGIAAPIISMGEHITLAASVITNLVTFAGSVFAWLMGVAIYTLLKPGSDILAEVFA